MFLLGGCAHEPTSTLSSEEALAGWWEEYAPAPNIVHFGADGTVSLYLKPGEVGTLRKMVGTWKIQKGGLLQMRWAARWCVGSASRSRAQKWC